MPEPLNCEAVAEAGLVERYVAGALSEEDAEAFESHYVTCVRCQADLRLAAAVRSVGREALRAAPRSNRLVFAAGAGALAAAAVVVLLLSSGGDRAAERFAPLGQVLQPPIYLGIPVRASEATADSLFEAAMNAYVAERYTQAASGLAAALQAGVDSAPAEFFRGASFLMLDEPREAAVDFRRVIALGETPYLAEAHYYLAKALLRLGRAAEAQEHLRMAAQASEELREPAGLLADSVQELLRR